MVKIKYDKKSVYQFVVHAKTGGMLLEGSPHNSMEMAKTSLKKVYALLETHNGLERKTNTKGEFLFQYKDGDKLLAKSLPYDSEAGMKNGIKNVKKLLQEMANREI